VLFNTYTFFAFLAVVLCVYYLPLAWWFKKAFLLVVSYLFYAAWNPPLVVILWLCTILDWYFAKAMHRIQQQTWRRVVLVGSLIMNLGLLGFFKYGGFAVENFLALTHQLGWDLQLARPDIILPVGISFYTFQSLTYTIDVYRRKGPPWHSFLDYALYVTFFPPLLAGPIVRAFDFLPQCMAPRRATGKQFAWGLCLVAIGIFEKNVLADGVLAPVVEMVYEAQGDPGFVSAWTGTLAFAGQIFCDFSGYSVCAIGIAMCMGFYLPDNFRFPYAAIGFSDFWKRWHISLSGWLRDYLYISLGGNRRGVSRTYSNLMVTMLLGGLWHGASWTFVIWGGLHGLYLVAERLIKRVVPAAKVWHYRPVKLLLGLMTFALVCVAWVFFRARTFSRAAAVVTAMLGWQRSPTAMPVGANYVAEALVVVAAILGFHWVMRDISLEQLAHRCPWWLRSVVLAAILICLMMLSGEERAFIYFQF